MEGDDKKKRVTRKATLRREGVTAEFESEFVSKVEGRKRYLAALLDPAFIKATNEFMSAFFPGGMCCSQCKTDNMTDQLNDIVCYLAKNGG